MKIELKEDGFWELHKIKSEPYKCHLCNDEGDMYFCKEKDRLYCKRCTLKIMDKHTQFYGCVDGEHTHYKVGNVIDIEDAKQEL